MMKQATARLRSAVFHRTEHLAEAELLPPATACPFCGSRERTAAATLQRDPEVLLLECPACHAASASRMPAPATLDRYYSDYYRSGDVPGAIGRVTFYGVDRLARHIAARVPRGRPGKELDILDFGGGDGSVAVAVARRLLGPSGAARITVVDYDVTPVAAGDERIAVAAARRLEDVPSPSRDLVVASAVIEHLPDPGETLVRLLAQLRPGGIFYARVPWVLPLMRLFRNWDFSYPGHLHDLGPGFWRWFVGRHGLVLKQSRPSPVETSLRHHFFRTVAAAALKAPWFVLGDRYRLVGGWEVFIEGGPR